MSSLSCVRNLEPTLINDNLPFHFSDPSEEEDSNRSYFEKKKKKKCLAKMSNIIFVKLYTFKKRIATILNYKFKGCMKGIIVLVNKLGRLITNCMGKETMLNIVFH